MNTEEIKRIDRITKLIYDVLNGKEFQRIEHENQANDEIRQLGEFANRLAQELNSISEYTRNLSTGKFKQEIKGNITLAQNLKNLQATLFHLTWQTNQVATGDFTQRVEFLGEFSNSFNWMVERLKSNRKKMFEQNTELKRFASEAKKTNEAKSLFLANMSHEIRTPMNGIMGFVDLLLDEELTQEQREAAETIKKSSENLLALINDILDLSKVESSKMELEIIPFNMENLLMDIGESMIANLGEKSVEINCRIGDIHTNLLGDPTRLRQIITNLIGNAIKFTKEGEIVLGVATEKEDEKRTTLKFSIADTGIGIPEDKLATIFESFQQADGSTTREYGGTGLGLTISRNFVRLMGGDIWAVSPSDCQPIPAAGVRSLMRSPGSVFYFTAIFSKKPKSSETIHPVAVSGLEGRRILIVDDSEAALQIISNIIKKAGMVPIPTKSGKEALACLNAKLLVKDATNDHFPEVAIIDIMMPDMSGHELAGKISGLIGEKIKMIACSSNPVIGSAAKTKDSGFTGFVSKPVRSQVLTDLIRTILGIGDEQPQHIVTRHSVEETISHDIRILYAEDNHVNQLLGKKMLERMGYDNIEIVPDGIEVVKAIKKNSPYDIIFMDIQMPNMSGREATKEIRKWEGNSSQFTEKNDKPATRNPQPVIHIPIIALTANAMKGDREICLEAGMDDYMTKPFKREDIQTMISKWVFRVKAASRVSKKTKILLVEDEEKMRNSIIRLLRKEMPATRVMTAEDGIDASAKLGSFAPDLILTDIMMPRMDGAEFVRYVRKTDRYAKTRIIAMTALHKDDARVLDIIDAGVEKVLYKTCENEDMVSIIKKAIGG